MVRWAESREICGGFQALWRCDSRGILRGSASKCLIGYRVPNSISTGAMRNMPKMDVIEREKRLYRTPSHIIKALLERNSSWVHLGARSGQGRHRGGAAGMLLQRCSCFGHP